MIDPSLFIHPSIAIPATSLVLVAFVLKARRKKYYRAHYAVVMAAFILTALAPPTLIPHLGMATISAILISVQSGLGITMLLRKKSRKSSLGLYRVHSRLGKLMISRINIAKQWETDKGKFKRLYSMGAPLNARNSNSNLEHRKSRVEDSWLLFIRNRNI